MGATGPTTPSPIYDVTIAQYFTKYNIYFYNRNNISQNQGFRPFKQGLTDLYGGSGINS